MIDAMKQAIEALEPFSTYGRPGSRDVETYRAITAITALRAAIEAAERRRPMAWAVEKFRNDQWILQYPIWHTKAHADEAIDLCGHGQISRITPLYTHPPAITDEMVKRAALAIASNFSSNLMEITRAALEAAWWVNHAE